jgi:hypothetical protein
VPRYFLHYVLCGTRIEDDEVYYFDDVGAAKWEAVLDIRSFVGHALLAGGTIPDVHVEIVDENGRSVLVIRHEDALKTS